MPPPLVALLPATAEPSKVIVCAFTTPSVAFWPTNTPPPLPAAVFSAIRLLLAATSLRFAPPLWAM